MSLGRCDRAKNLCAEELKELKTKNKQTGVLREHNLYYQMNKQREKRLHWPSEDKLEIARRQHSQ